MNTFHRLLAVALVAVSAVAAPAAQAADKVVVSYLPTLHGLPLFVAIEEGMFKKAGIDIESAKFESPNQIIDSLISGRADSAPAGGAAGITALAESKFPGRLKVFGLQGANLARDMVNDALIVKQDSSIGSFADLKGKKLAHAPGIQWRTVARTVAKANKLDPDRDVELVEMAIGLHAQAVAAGTVDAALTLEPVGSLVAATGKVKVALVNPAAHFIADPFYAGAGVISAKFLAERPGVARRFIAVMDEAVTMVQGDFDKYRKYLVKYTPVTPETIALIKPMYFRNSQQISKGDIAAYQKFVDSFEEAGTLKQHIDVAKLLYIPNANM